MDVSVVNGIDLSEQDLKFGRSEIKSEAGFDYGLQRIIEGKDEASVGEGNRFKGKPDYVLQLVPNESTADMSRTDGLESSTTVKTGIPLTESEQQSVNEAFELPVKERTKKLNEISKQIAERIKKERVKAKSKAYHKAKADGSNPELVAAVEELLGKPKAVTPNVEDWSKDVESTAKALEGVDETQLISGEDVWNNATKAGSENNDFIENTEEYEGQIKGRQYLKVPISIDLLRANDKDLNEYLNDIDTSVKKRKIETPIIVGDAERGAFETTKDGVIDGFHRAEQAIINGEKNIIAFVPINSKIISEAYHKAKADGSNPELVKAVEELLGQKQSPSVQVGEAVVESEQAIEALKDVESTAKALEGVGKEKGKNVFEIGKKIYDTIFSDLDTKENEIRAFLNIDEKQRDKQLQLEKGKLDKLQRQYDRKQLITENDINALEKQKEKVELIDGLLKSQKVSISDIDNQLAKYALDKYPNIFTKKETYPFYTAKGYDNVKNEIISEAYHKAKADGSNPELVKAVEDLLAPKVAPTTNTEGETQTTEAQLQEFGVPEQAVKPVTNGLTAMVDGLRKAGLTAAKTVGEFAG